MNENSVDLLLISNSIQLLNNHIFGISSNSTIIWDKHA